MSRRIKSFIVKMEMPDNWTIPEIAGIIRSELKAQLNNYYENCDLIVDSITVRIMPGVTYTED